MGNIGVEAVEAVLQVGLPFVSLDLLAAVFVRVRVLGFVALLALLAVLADDVFFKHPGISVDWVDVLPEVGFVMVLGFVDLLVLLAVLLDLLAALLAVLFAVLLADVFFFRPSQ